MAEIEVRRYRLPPLVSAGLFGAFSGGQVVSLGVGGAVGLACVLAGWAAFGGVAMAIGAVVAFKQVGTFQMHEVVPLQVGWLRRRLRGELRWARPIPLLGATDRVAVPLPAVMAGVELLELPAAAGRDGSIGVIHDRASGSVSVVLAARGDGQFSLSSPPEQDRQVASWGDAIAGFCRENTAVTRVTWQEWSTVGAADVHAEPVAVSSEDPIGKATADYRQLLERVGPTSTSHETLLTVTVDLDRVRLRRRQVGDALGAAIDAVIDEARLFAGRMESGGLHVDRLLTPAEVTTAVRRRADPTVIAHQHALHRSLAASVGRAAVDFGPMALAERWSHVQVDRAVHRTYWVQSWPRLEVPAGWMDPLLLGVHGTRTLTVVFEPIAPSAAARAVDQAAIALDAAEATRAKHGFRIRASERRKRSEIEAREHELVAGHGDLACVGLLTVTATDEDALDDVAADHEAAAGHAGVTLRPLESRHATGWVAALPLGRSLARGRLA